MRKSLAFKKTISLLLPLSMILGVSLSIGKTKVFKVDASSYSVSSVPTTIDLNDSTASEIRNYYSSLNSLATSQRQGTNLLKNLKPILKNNQKYLSYGSSATTAVWQAYEIVDRDWSKSPASSISGYNSSTNKITGYTYGTSNSNTGSNPYIHALYVNRNVTNQTQAWGNHNQDQWGINQEHIWAKSCGFNDNSPAAGARGDIMHLWAGNGKVNGTYHSNYYYGYVDTTKSYDDASSYASTLSGNRKGKSRTLGGSYTVFEPQDSDKGDIARALFYMAARYNYLSGSDSDGIDAGNPSLEIVNILNWAPGSSYTSTTSNKGQMGILQDLLEWNRLDPPDEWEIHRNNLCYKNYTNNRNPFIDFPEWAEFIWGKSVNGNYSSSSTGYATPSSDTLNGYSGGQSTVAVTGVSLNKDSTSIEVGKNEVLIASISPSNATNQSLTWTSSNTSVATVSSGTVVGVSEGNTVITVTTNDGSFTDTCNVTIVASSGGSSNYSATVAYSDSFSPALPTSSSSVNTSDTLHTDSTSGFKFKEQGIYKGSSSSYLMFAQDKGFLYNTEDLGTIDSVSVTYSGGTSTSGKIGVYFGSSEQSTYVTSSNSTIKGQSETETFENSVEGNGYFQLSSSNKNVQITQIQIDYHASGSPSVPTSISATVNKTFYVGDTLSSSDISVEDNLGNSITNFEFDDYVFCYEDTPGGGNVTFESDFDIEYNSMETTLTVDVCRKPYIDPQTQSVILTSSKVFNDIGGSNNNLVSGSVTKDGITYTYSKAYYYSGGSSLSFGNASSQTGYLQNQTAFSAGITNVEVTNTGRAVNIRYSTDGSTWVLKENANTSTNNYFYFKVDCVGNTGSNYSNITEITITLKAQETPNNVANYIMFEDAANQCTSKFSVAKGYFENLTKTQRNTFMTSSDYVISTARTRFEAWARSLGKSITLSNGDYVISSAQFGLLDITQKSNADYAIVVIICLLAVSSGSIICCYFIKRKRAGK